MTLKLSVGIVVYRPNLKVLQKTLTDLQEACVDFGVSCYLINNSQEIQERKKMEVFAKYMPLSFQLFHNPQNIGYGAAHNIAIKASSVPYHLVLNPDAFLYPDALKNALEYMNSHPEVGLVCPKVFNEDGTQQFVHRKDPTLFDMFLRSFAPAFVQRLFMRRKEGFLLKYLNWEEIQDIESPSGCCMLFRTEVLKKIGGFDENFFMYYEDSDIGRRVRQIAQVKYLPTFRVVHLWVRDSHKSSHMKRVIITSGWKYFKKWGSWF